MKTFLKLFIMLFCVLSFAQTTVKGKVIDDKGLPLPSANIIIAGSATGTTSDFEGNYTLTTDLNPPFTIKISYTGFETKTEQVTSNNQTINVTLIEGNELDEVVISASRTPERIFESPVTVERFGAREIKNTASSSFYNGLENLKGVDINTGSLTFKQVNTRGFADFNNGRFVQLIDGADNSIPALNIVIGNLVGASELDVKSVEILPGASSALYGANAFNGILFIQTKNPFDDQGVKAYVKTGFTSQDAAGENEYYDVGFRGAHKFSDKFAAEINFSYLKGTDWFANSEQDIDTPGGTRQSNVNFNGLNVFGDEVSTNIRAASGGLGIIPDVNVSRTGYNEQDLTDFDAESVKADWTLAYRPWGDDFEISYNGRVGVGSTVFQATNRNYLDDFFFQQHKVEIKNDNFFVRGYVNDDDAGNSYDLVFTGININRAWKSDQQWFGDYIGAFALATFGGQNEGAAHAFARGVADEDFDIDASGNILTGEVDGVRRLIPGTPEFQQTFDRVTQNPDFSSGSSFQDESKFYHVDANYNFSHLIEDIFDLQAGGSFRENSLNSNGTIFTDNNSGITYNEVGAYVQIQKELVDERLKLTGSGRFDKNELFDGFFTPRFSVGYTLGEERNHNIRTSVQTGFRNPTSQNLFLGLDVGSAILLGSAPGNPERFERNVFLSDGTLTTLNGSLAFNNAYTATSAAIFAATGDPSVLEVGNLNPVMPEQVTSFEVGYRSQLFDKKVTIDVNGYYNTFRNFLASEVVVSPLVGSVLDASGVQALAAGNSQAFQVTTNSDADIESFGATTSITTKVFGDFNIGVNYTFSDFEFDQDSDPDFRPGFNTPKHKVKASFGNSELFKNFGFNIAWRWSDSYFWQAPFADGNVPAFNTVDLQINYSIPSIKSNFRLSASNLTGNEFITAIGPGPVGSIFLFSWTINNL
ncbi:TonB-dependent receptor [Winogradskyella immobilis]|uniref:Carboxypeptidase-like regulatory domain-containing protein n=1 Tax=Winogradskyella immobilis TaxID=2816852 RepID=A0ABS8EPZ8_9FLAO|nr:carboxypeptidase-like regulatory domain-containing protein [Winogradskyella immobilis]MCC1485296.1 carboxypeptidase-like regulatory domain-containing protein [Winogradskyella immobilis]MCG0017388.1 TonB-dependent receptor [Winogradskyella immobilis]